MSIINTEVKRFVVENTMGDGKVQVKVKYVTYSYLMGKCINVDTVFDPITFPSKEVAEEYARYTTGPCKKSIHAVNDSMYSEKADSYYGTWKSVIVREPGYANSKSNTNYYEFGSALKRLMYREITGVYDIDTPYNKHVIEVNQTMEKMGLLDKSRTLNSSSNDHYQYNLLYITYKEVYELKNKTCEESKCGFIIAKMWESPYDGACKCEIKDTTVYDKLQEAYDEFSKETSEKINKVLNEEKKKRLAETVITSLETNIDSERLSDVKSVEAQLTQLDEDRNELIKKELARTSEYMNMLKSLLK